jgi:integrase/recombinase XerD
MVINKLEATSTIEILPWGSPGNYGGIVACKGSNRGGSSAFNVQTDAEAVAVWIADTGSSSINTAQAYRREAERLLLWSSHVKNKSLSQLFREDYLEFLMFLSAVPADWIMNKRHKRDSPEWRPFLGQPSTTSQRQTMVIIKSLINYLVKASWLKHNPLPASKSKNQNKPKPVLRSLYPPEIECVSSYLEAMPELPLRKATIKARDQWLFYLFLTMAPRRGEVSLPMSSFVRRPIGGDLTWVWEIVGKGKKEDDLILHPKAIIKLMEFRSKLKISALPQKNDPIPIMPSMEGLTSQGTLNTIPAPMSPNAIHKRFKKIFAGAAAIADAKGIDSSQLRICSTHWLRHTSIREMYDKTNDIKVTQQHARHSDINTTAHYAQQDLKKMKDIIFSS